MPGERQRTGQRLKNGDKMLREETPGGSGIHGEVVTVVPLLSTTRLRKKSNVEPDEEEAGQGSQGGGDRSSGPLDSWGGISSQKWGGRESGWQRTEGVGR